MINKARLLIFKVGTNLLLGLFIGVMATPLQAESTDQFGRLFSKPTERNNLNVLRQNQKLKIISVQETLQPEMAADPALAEPITLQGYVKRSDGISTLWINKQAVQENSTIDNLEIGRLNQREFSKKAISTEGIDVKILADGKKIRLKAGQMYAPETNQILEMQVVEKAKRYTLEETGVIDSDDGKP